MKPPEFGICRLYRSPAQALFVTFGSHERWERKSWGRPASLWDPLIADLGPHPASSHFAGAALQPNDRHASDRSRYALSLSCALNCRFRGGSRTRRDQGARVPVREAAHGGVARGGEAPRRGSGIKAAAERQVGIGPGSCFGEPLDAPLECDVGRVCG